MLVTFKGVVAAILTPKNSYAQTLPGFENMTVLKKKKTQKISLRIGKLGGDALNTYIKGSLMLFT